MPAPSRHRFRFSLKTLLIVVTILSAGGGYGVHQWQKVKERQRVLRETEKSTRLWTTFKTNRFWFAASGPDTWTRRALGDRHYDKIWFDPPLLIEKRNLLQATFPEATVVSGRPPFDPGHYTNYKTFAGPHRPPPGVRRKLDE